MRLDNSEIITSVSLTRNEVNIIMELLQQIPVNIKSLSYECAKSIMHKMNEGGHINKNVADPFRFFMQHRCNSPFKGGYLEHLSRVHKEIPEVYNKYSKKCSEEPIFWNTWLFSYCFGIKESD